MFGAISKIRDHFEKSYSLENLELMQKLHKKEEIDPRILEKN